MARQNDKRSRLVKAADKLFHEQGVNTTTLANIAQLADVPLGNVYYYFKSKESIVLAVVEYRRSILQSQFEELSHITDAKGRINALLNLVKESSEITASFGDALGSLCQEAGKQGGIIAEAASALMSELLGWAQKQFVALGKEEALASKYALNLIASIQGMSLMTLTFKDQSYTNQQAQFISDWLETI